ncbi:hypothetical protein BURKHO8Y_520141 [Burkholderia sp. 8Y]|nr:hypothetical protein BURKHO8Y_520141 [Burkholderia sp. 8Y]
MPSHLACNGVSRAAFSRALQMNAESRAACLALALGFAETRLIRVVFIHRKVRRFKQRCGLLQQCEEVAHVRLRLVIEGFPLAMIIGFARTDS